MCGNCTYINYRGIYPIMKTYMEMSDIRIRDEAERFSCKKFKTKKD